jgi:hypothetical protein
MLSQPAQYVGLNLLKQHRIHPPGGGTRRSDVAEYGRGI